MSIQTKFERAVAIVQGLPKDGPVQPSQDDQLVVRFFFDVLNLFQGTSLTHLFTHQFYKYYKQGRFLPTVHPGEDGFQMKSMRLGVPR